MELMELCRVLVSILGQAVLQLEKAGYSWEDELFSGLEWDIFDPEALYHVRALEEAARNVYRAYEDLSESLRTPKTDTYKLHRLKNGRFGYQTSRGLTIEMCCGRHIEALIVTEGHPYWVECRIEYAEGDYYLCRYYEPLEGLLVREPR